MRIVFLNSDGTDKVVTQYSGPGRSYRAPLVEIVRDWMHVEGDIVHFHVGHGSYRFYSVVAQDADTALVQHVSREHVAEHMGVMAARGYDVVAAQLKEMLMR